RTQPRHFVRCEIEYAKILRTGRKRGIMEDEHAAVPRPGPTALRLRTFGQPFRGTAAVRRLRIEVPVTSPGRSEYDPFAVGRPRIKVVVPGELQTREVAACDIVDPCLIVCCGDHQRQPLTVGRQLHSPERTTGIHQRVDMAATVYPDHASVAPAGATAQIREEATLRDAEMRGAIISRGADVVENGD